MLTVLEILTMHSRRKSLLARRQRRRNGIIVTGSAVAADGKSITLTFDADLKDGVNLTESGFEVSIDGDSYTPTLVERSASVNNQLVLTLSADITAITDDHGC